MYIYMYIYIYIHTYICFLVTPRGMRDLSSPTRDEPSPPAVEACSVNDTGLPGKSQCHDFLLWIFSQMSFNSTGDVL